MKFGLMEKKQWSEIKKIYLEAFPRRERKPFFALKRSVRKGKAQIFVATEDAQVLGFVVAIPYQDMVMVDYLAVTKKIRSKGTGSFIMQEICKKYADKKIVLLIEKVNKNAENYDQRVARRKFYLKNEFKSTNYFLDGKSGEMEILYAGGKVSQDEFMELQKYALGKLFFKLAKMRFI